MPPKSNVDRFIMHRGDIVIEASPARVTKLEDRVLVLKDQVDVLAKDYDPNQPRDEEGKWSLSGMARAARGWMDKERIKAAAEHVTPKVKDVTAEVVANIITRGVPGVAPFGGGVGSDIDTEFVKQQVLNFSTHAQVTVGQAKEHLISVFKYLRKGREDDMKKAERDPVLQQLDAIIAALEAIDVEALEKEQADKGRKKKP